MTMPQWVLDEIKAASNTRLIEMHTEAVKVWVALSYDSAARVVKDAIEEELNERMPVRLPKFENKSQSN